MPDYTLISALPYADGPDQPSIPFHTNNLAKKLDPLIIPPFGSAQLRDATITPGIRGAAPNGGEGLHCYIVNSGMWEYDGVVWQPMGLRVALSRTYHDVTATANSTAPGAVPGLHGQQFTLNRNRICRATITDFQVSGYAGDQWQFYANWDGGARAIIAQGVFVNTGGAGSQRLTFQSAPFVLAAGTHNMGVYILRASGTGGYVTLLDATLTITDEGPA